MLAGIKVMIYSQQLANIVKVHLFRTLNTKGKGKREKRLQEVMADFGLQATSINATNPSLVTIVHNELPIACDTFGTDMKMLRAGIIVEGQFGFTCH